MGRPAVLSRTAIAIVSLRTPNYSLPEYRRRILPGSQKGIPDGAIGAGYDPGDQYWSGDKRQLSGHRGSLFDFL
ncbi:hypothetical protein AB0L35_37760 [Streptomyces sp. NPDC052309]|uniref:hypothetical protein n=1 Tax=Streptomyces sp. NPDC052309 TaxID=3155421 RepID=UPI00342D3FF2